MSWSCSAASPAVDWLGAEHGNGNCLDDRLRHLMTNISNSAVLQTGTISDFLALGGNILQDSTFDARIAIADVLKQRWHTHEITLFWKID